MNNKIIIFFMLICFLNYLSCTSLSVVTNESAKEEIVTGSYLKELQIQTRDSNIFYFEPWSYQFVNDTLYGNGTKKSSNSEELFEGRIAVVEIISYETQEFDIMKTSGLLLGVAALVLIGYVIVFSIAFGSI